MKSTSATVVPDSILAIEDLHVSYGGSRILQGVTLQLGAGPLSIVGRNGMGKTTLCQAIVGLAPVAKGSIRFGEAAITGRRPYEIARRGIGYVPQGRRVFPSLTVEEHLRLASSMGRPGKWTIEEIHGWFPRLAERRRHGASALSGGEQQMLAIARALLLNPDLVIMDEPTEGLAPVMVDSLTDLLRAVAAGGMAVLLVEQNLMVATAVAERVAIMVNGTIALETSAATIQSDVAMQRRYLGVSV